MLKKTSDSTWQEQYLDFFYRSKPGWKNGTAEFWDLIKAEGQGAQRVLEVGCGPANKTSKFLSQQFPTVDGLDIDPDIDNEYIETLHLYNGHAWPVPSASYDLIVCDYVLEHVEDADIFVEEVARVLKAGGKFICRTPNLWYYVSLAAKCTPHWAHVLLANPLRKNPDDTHDPWPTFFRLNRRSDLRKQFAQVNMQEVQLRMVEKEPSYGMISRALFIPFMMYERVVNSTERLAVFRGNILGVFQKEG